jgi:hypothetical protein
LPGAENLAREAVSSGKMFAFQAVAMKWADFSAQSEGQTGTDAGFGPSRQPLWPAIFPGDVIRKTRGVEIRCGSMSRYR